MAVFHMGDISTHQLDGREPIKMGIGTKLRNLRINSIITDIPAPYDRDGHLFAALETTVYGLKRESQHHHD
jgi:hypothetical protein